MGSRPSSLHSIERIDVDGDYRPGNCKWATDHEQNRNRRSNRIFTVNGQTLCMTDWAKKIGIPYKTLWQRIARGASMEEIVNA